MADDTDADTAAPAVADDGHANDLRCTSCGLKADSLVIQRGRTEYDLASCPRCNQLIDTYIEHPTTLLLVDLLLAKPSVYRHLLYNRNASRASRERPHATGKATRKRRMGAIRISLAIFLVQTYLTWSMQVLQHGLPDLTLTFILHQICETALWHILALVFTASWCSVQRRSRPSLQTISQGLAFSSITKLFFMALSLVWRDVLPSDQLYLETYLLTSAEMISRSVALSVILNASTTVGAACTGFCATMVYLVTTWR